MNPLVVFYSRTGTTKKAGLKIAEILNCDFEEIFGTKNRSGALGYVAAGRDATLKKIIEIKHTEKNPADYDMVIIGTPVWAFTMASAIRTYITLNKDNFKKVAFFCTSQSSGGKGPFKHMEELGGIKPIALLDLATKEVSEGKFEEKVREFVEELA